MNFKEFEELINSGAKEITLTEDVLLEDGEEEEYDEGIEINSDDLIIDGNDYAIDGCRKASLFIINASNITLKNILIKNCYCEYSGAAIDNRSNLIIENCRFVDNSSDDLGGSIYNASNSNLTIQSSIFEENKSDFGGAIYNDSILNISNSIFKSNSSEFDGGAIYNRGNLVIKNSLFDKNAAVYGGAIYNENILTVESSEFKNCIANDGNHIETENKMNFNIIDCRFD
ncbi:right-handed parallel beta-helix repeat-containing protein [uncultured Methanobrevibacter sp.]|uniref:right-handed parallel beta-helix repeat-containing protein n=1 Tax=uncultured Methanobrevibacter sp. TaxID=253161 RepID=UPI002619DBA8|nr:right-handed parallel beta-helix repeat-containing protein [uncultured Methanobrevibacter sp.]